MYGWSLGATIPIENLLFYAQMLHPPQKPGSHSYAIFYLWEMSIELLDKCGQV